MKLLIYLAVWKRPEITEICFMGINRLKKAGLFPIEALAVISEKSMIPLCEKYDIKYCFHENEPLGRKKNYGLSQALKLQWDYLVEIGSDDLLYNRYLEVIGQFIGKHEVLTIDNIVFINSLNGDCIQYKTNKPFGLGRVMSRHTVEKIGDIWNDEQCRGLDKVSWLKIALNGLSSKQIRTEHPLGIDIKSETNIWKFNPEIGTHYDLDKAMEGLSDEEEMAIRSLSCATV